MNSLFSVFGFGICFSFTLHLFTIPFCLGLVLSLFWIFSSIAFFVWCVHVDICLFVVLFLWIFFIFNSLKIDYNRFLAIKEKCVISTPPPNNEKKNQMKNQKKKRNQIIYPSQVFLSSCAILLPPPSSPRHMI